MSYYISKIKNIDIKHNGSKNYGTANTVLLVGKSAGLIVFIHDALKALLSISIANALFPSTPHVGVIAGCASVLGHIFPFYLHFDGGKGFASFIGMALMLYPLPGVIAFLIAIGLALLTDYLVVGTFAFISIVPIIALINGAYVAAIVISGVSVLVFVKHKANIINIWTKNGKEARIFKALKQKSKQ
jgi:glycerol-3-phosphate acyltransferase PlsY